MTWRSVRWLAVACVAAGAVTAVLLSWPSPSASAPAPAPFADRDGLVVFEQQPSGLLGTASPDGRDAVMLTRVGALQGTDLPVAASDGRYLVNLEGQLVTMGRAGPASVSSLPVSAAAQAAGFQWATASFADGGRYVVATACHSANNASWSWVADLIPVVGGQEQVLGAVRDSAGDPESAGALVSAPTGPSTSTLPDECFFGLEKPPDKAVQLLRPGQAPRTIVTAAGLTAALGWPPGTPVLLSASPSPDGSRLALRVVAVETPQQQAERMAPRQAVVVLTRAGRIVAQRPLPAATGIEQWSPDGQRIASCQASGQTPSTVTVWAVDGPLRTIVLPGHHDLACSQLLWSPDGSQLIYAAWAKHGLTLADELQHGWTVIDLRSGRVHDVTAPGQPAAWLPARTTAGETG
jgi:hypothetical protein